MAFKQAGVELVADGLSGFMSSMDKANSAVAKFGSQGADAGSAFSKGFGQVTIGALRQVGAAMVDFGIQAAQATAAFVGDSISLAGDFEQGMQSFRVAVGKDVDAKGIEQFHDLFLQLGKDLPVSTSDVQKAAIEMVKGGISPAIVAAGGLKQNIQFAAAAMEGDLVGAAEISAKVLGGWSEQGATAADNAAFLTHATDQLTKAANASSVDVHELSLGIFNAQGTAKAAGVSFDDLTTTLAELAPRFASASEAGNSLKNFMVRLQPTTKPATEAMQDLGLMTTSTTKIMQFLKDAGIKPLGTDLDTLGNQFTEFAASQGFTAKQTTKIWESFAQSKFFDEATGKFVGMQKASQLLQDATKGLTDAQKVQALQTIFGNDAMNSAAALAELGSAGYQNMADSLAKANGVAEAGALMQQGYNTALENAKGSVEAFQIQLGERLLPVLTGFLNNVVSPGINMLGTLTDAFFGNQKAVDALPGPLQTLIGWFKIGYDWVGKNLPPAIAALSRLWTGTLQPALMDVVGVFKTYVIPIISDLAQTVFPILGSALKVGASAFVNVLLPVITTIWTFFKNNILPILADVAHWLKDNVPPAVAVLANFLSNTLFPALGKVWAFTDKNLIPILVAVAEVLGATVGVAVSALAGLWEKVLWPVLKKVGGWISDSLGPVLRDFGRWLENVTGGVDGISEAIQGVIRWIKDLIDAIKKIKLPDWATPGSPMPWETAWRGVGDALKTEVNPQIKALFNTLQVAPPASASQILSTGASGNTTIYNGPVGPQVHMPVHTNMTPAAIAQSMAIATAVLP